jgi:hypothetical protein
MFGDVVMGVPHTKFEHQLEKLKVRWPYKHSSAHVLLAKPTACFDVCQRDLAPLSACVACVLCMCVSPCMSERVHVSM